MYDEFKVFFTDRSAPRLLIRGSEDSLIQSFEFCTMGVGGRAWIGPSAAGNYPLAPEISRRLGAPVATETLADGTTTKSFDVQAPKRGPSYEMPMPGVPGAFYTTNGPSVVGTCRLTFTIANHVVSEASAPPECL